MKLKILELLFPTICPYCNKVINYDNEYGFCEDCKNSIELVVEPREIIRYNESTVICISPFKYETQVRKAIHGFKFKGKTSYNHMFSKSMYNALVSYCGKDINLYDVVTFVPFSKKQKINRDYNHSMLLAKALANQLNLPCRNLLKKIADNKTQHELKASERVKNVKNVYEVSNVNKVKGKNIILCDDIVTTGSTLKENANKLIYAGAKSVICVTLASAYIIENKSIYGGDNKNDS